MGKLGLALILLAIVLGVIVGDRTQIDVWDAALVTIPGLLGLWAWSRA